MGDVLLVAAIVEAFVAVLLMGRVARGPTVADRLVAVNATSTQVTLSMVCFAAYENESIYLDVTLWMAAFSYLATFVWSRLIERELL
ncbi:MAG TPA: monovalent cation/H+ antiporter complex subunit F [Mycobacteriales bacterium]|nr:monovalent cation/H+ antiporter complex subunit F [Mycobacteriales bacterium]